MGMTRDEVLAELHSMRSGQRDEHGDLEWRDQEDDHRRADSLLLALIDDADITAAFEAIYKWYA